MSEPIGRIFAEFAKKSNGEVPVLDVILREIATLRTRLAEAERDLVLFDWMCKNWSYAHGVISLNGLFDLGPLATLREAIQAAIAKEQGNE